MKRMSYFHIATCWLFCCLLVITACSQKDNAINPDLPFSRLLVSNAITDSASNGISLFNPADVNPLGAERSFNMQNPLPKGITYDQYDNRGFQIGMTSKTIKSFSINTDGSLRYLNTFTDTLITDGRDLAYNYLSKELYLANTADSTLRIYTNASSAIGNAVPRNIFKLVAKPTGVFYTQKNLLLVMGEDKKVQCLTNIAGLDSAEVSFEAEIASATELSGIWYSADRDILFLTDIGIEDNAGDGALFIIEGAFQKLSAGGIITADRVITGNNTLLGNPVAVSFDEREGKDIIYVAEKLNKKILAFQLTDNGNVSPFINNDRLVAPESLWLNAH